MALPNLSPRTVNVTGADCTGSDGASNRTYTFPESTVTPYAMNVSVSGATLHEGTGKDFTISSSVITFLNALWDTSVIRVSYFITYGDPTASSLTTTTTLKYATPLMLGEMLGLIKEIPSWEIGSAPTTLEDVGTGDNSETTFYLDQNHVVSDSYTLYANDVEMTETTHYVLTADTGKIVLTTAGVIMLSTNKLTAKYKYFSNGMDDSYIIAVLGRSEIEVDKAVNSTFVDGSSANPAYPTETEIQASEGYFQDRIITEKKPIIDIESALDGDITSSDTTISLASATGGDLFPSTGYIIVGSEVISYTGISADDLTGCTRGELGTTAAAHDDGDAVHSTIVFRSDTTEGTAVSWTIQPWQTSIFVDAQGLIYKFKNASPDSLTRTGVAERIKIIYRYGYKTIPLDITRLTLLFAKKALANDSVGSAVIQGRDEFKPEVLNVDSEEIQKIINSYIILPMGNT